MQLQHINSVFKTLQPFGKHLGYYIWNAKPEQPLDGSKKGRKSCSALLHIFETHIK